jgi:hypothetical protein
MAIEDRDYMRENDDAPKRPELRPDIPWHSASQMSDEEYKGWLTQKVDRPWFTIVVTVLLGIVGLYLVGDDVMREFVYSFIGR